MSTNIQQTHGETLQQLDNADIEIATLKKQLVCEREKHLVSEGLLIEANKRQLEQKQAHADKLADMLAVAWRLGSTHQKPDFDTCNAWHEALAAYESKP